MNDKTIELIQKLADKLGTTGEHLWGVLVRQAPYSSAMDVISIIAILLVYKFLWKKHAGWVKENDEYQALTWGMVVLLGIIFLIWIVLSLPQVISGFTNPEYWALKQLMP